MKKQIPFTILVPVTDMELDPESRHIGDMSVEATAYQYGDGSLLMDDDNERPDVDISLFWNSVNVTTLMATLAPDFVYQCRLAAAEHARQFDEYKEPELENGSEDADAFAERVDSHFENELMSH